MKINYKTTKALKKECAEFAASAAAEDFSAYSSAELQEQLKKPDLKPVTLAALVSEVIYRLKGIRLFQSQLQAAYSLFGGHITELATGEGKTLAGVVAAVLFAKSGRTVHILVFNDYLAQRDAAENREIFEFCGLTVGCITEHTSFANRKAAYGCSVVYAPAREAGYDCIRSFLAASPEQFLLPAYDVAIVDEADSILIDEAAIPLVLAGKASAAALDFLQKIITVVRALNAQDYECNLEQRQIWLSDSGIKAVESALLIDNLYDEKNMETLSAVNTALEAVYLLKRDVDYIVKNGKIGVIDESTGRVAANRKFPGALQKYVELKEGITDRLNTRIFNSMTIGAFIAQYQTLCGMTGTAVTSASELETTYGVRTLAIAPHTPCIRNDLPDEVFLTNSERDSAVIAEIIAAHQKGQPVLVGTASVEQSELLAKSLRQNGIEPAVLNARNDAEEAKIIANAGLAGAVTVSTNMAGRGVDIKLGGQNGEGRNAVALAGGLYVISTTVNRSRRIDNQLRGRSGRQGDVGQSKFFISLQDENIAPFFEEELTGKKLTNKEKFALVRDAQLTLEGNDAEARYAMKKYTYITEEQRQLISNYRKKVLFLEEQPQILQKNDLDRYLELEKQIGAKALQNAERHLLLYYLNLRFSDYLETMEEVKSGIHLNIVAGKNPLDEFNRQAIDNFEEMNADIRFEVLQKMQQLKIVNGAPDLTDFNINHSTGTWTYMVDDSSGQFNHLPELLNMFGKKIKKALSFTDKLERMFTKKKDQ